MKKFLLFVLSMVVTMGAKATGEWSIDFAELGANYDDKTGVTISASVATIGGTTMGTCTVGSDALNENFVLQTGTTWLMRKASGLYQGNGGGRAMGMLACTKGQIITIVGTGDPNPSTNATLKSSSGNTYVYTVNDDGDVKFTPARYLYFTSITVENPSASAVAYTVKYVDGEGNEIKTATEGTSEAGENITVSEVEKSNFVADGKKYIYVSDDSDGKTVEADGSSVVTITFREAATWNYTVNFVAGDNILDTKNGSVFEGDAAKVFFPRFILDEENQVLYQNKDAYEFSYSFTPTADNQERNIEFTAKETETNVVFYKEAEDIEGVTGYEDGFTQIRMSNGAVGIANNEGEKVAIASLQPGKYTFVSSSRSGSTKFYLNEEELYTLTSTGAVVINDPVEFTVKEESNIYAFNEEGNTNYFDYVLIRKTGDYNYLTVEGELQDSITANVGEVPDLSKIHPQSNATEITYALYIAEGAEGADKAEANYSAYTDAEDIKNVLSAPGIYYIYAAFTGTFADESTLTVNTDTIVATIVEPNYLDVESTLPDTLSYVKGTPEDEKPKLSDYIKVSTNAIEYAARFFTAKVEAGADKAAVEYTSYKTEDAAKAAMSEPGLYYCFGWIVGAFPGENDTYNYMEAYTDTIVVEVKEAEEETETIGVEPGIWYSYIYTATGVSTTPAVTTTGGTFSAGGTKVSEENNSHIGIKTNFTATVTLGRALKENDIITLKIWAGSANVNSGLDISTDGTTSLHYFQLPSTNAKTNVYDVQYIVKADDGICGLSEFKISKITGSPNVYLNGVTVEVPEMKAPEYSAQPAGSTVVTNSTVTLKAAASGFPEPTYQWYLNGLEIEGATSASYDFNAAETGSYTFTVVATNSQGSVTSDEAVVKVINYEKALTADSYVVSTEDEVADRMYFSTPNVIVTLADKGGFKVQAADAAEAPAGYSAIISGTVNPTVNGNNVTGVAYNVLPLKTGVFTFVGKFNPNKAINIMKLTYDVNAKAAAGSLQADEETVSFKVGETEYNSGDSFSETYNGPISFDVEDEYEYFIYASGSKIGMYGFDFTEATAVDGVSEAQESVKKEGKFIENGQIVILKAGKKFNAAGAQIK